MTKKIVCVFLLGLCSQTLLRKLVVSTNYGNLKCIKSASDHLSQYLVSILTDKETKFTSKNEG